MRVARRTAKSRQSGPGKFLSHREEGLAAGRGYPISTLFVFFRIDDDKSRVIFYPKIPTPKLLLENIDPSRRVWSDKRSQCFPDIGAGPARRRQSFAENWSPPANRRSGCHHRSAVQFETRQERSSADRCSCPRNISLSFCLWPSVLCRERAGKPSHTQHGEPSSWSTRGDVAGISKFIVFLCLWSASWAPLLRGPTNPAAHASA